VSGAKSALSFGPSHPSSTAFQAGSALLRPVPGSLVVLALAGTLRVGLVGVAFGFVGAFWSSRLLGQFLFGIEAWDLVTYLAMAAALLG